MDLAIPWRSIRKYTFPQCLCHTITCCFRKRN